jgi:hypothetical protein
MATITSMRNEVYITSSRGALDKGVGLIQLYQVGSAVTAI